MWQRILRVAHGRDARATIGAPEPVIQCGPRNHIRCNRGNRRGVITILSVRFLLKGEPESGKHQFVGLASQARACSLADRQWLVSNEVQTGTRPAPFVVLQPRRLRI